MASYLFGSSRSVMIPVSTKDNMLKFDTRVTRVILIKRYKSEQIISEQFGFLYFIVSNLFNGKLKNGGNTNNFLY
jgi:hypothetical protein